MVVPAIQCLCEVMRLDVAVFSEAFDGTYPEELQENIPPCSATELGNELQKLFRVCRGLETDTSFMLTLYFLVELYHMRAAEDEVTQAVRDSLDNMRHCYNHFLNKQ